MFETPFTDPVMIVLILLATALFVPFISRRIRLPDIAVLIIAGVLLGPYMGDLLTRDEAVKLFADVGLLSLMFLAGLEIDIREYRKSRAKSFIFGTLTFIVPMIVGYFAGVYTMGMNEMQALLFASLLASHTLIAYPVLSRLRISDEVVAITVGGTIIANVAALLVLSAVVSLHDGEMTTGLVAGIFVKLVLYMFFMITLLPRFAAWALAKLENDGKLQFLFVFVILFFSAMLAKLAGIEPIIGAFMSGIALGRSVPAVSPLGNRIDFFANAIFIPSFLISVGMLVDIHVIFSDSKTIYAALVMMAVILLSKWIAAFFSQKAFSWNWVRREFVFGLSIGQAAGTLAVAMIGVNIGIFGMEILNGGIVAILLTAILSPIIVQATGKRIACEAAPVQADQDFSRRRILIGAQEKTGNERLLELALMLHDPKGITDMRAVTVVDSYHDTKKRVEAIEKHLTEYSKDVAAAGHKIDFGPRIASSVAIGLANGASEFTASDIVIGLGQRKFVLSRTKVSTILTELAERTDTRIIAARLFSPLATTPRMALFLPPEIEFEEDFAGTIAAVKCFARQSHLEFTCYGTETSVKKARELFEANPSLAGITWEPCRHDALSHLLKEAEGLRCVLLARHDGASWSREMRQVKQVVDSLSNDSPLIVFCPSVKRSKASGVSVIPDTLGKFWGTLLKPWARKTEKTEEGSE
jgi:Kef-type K+ transport system membrane component KefB